MAVVVDHCNGIFQGVALREGFLMGKGIPHMDNRQVQRIQSMMKAFRLDVSEEAVGSLLQFVRFGVVGVSNTLISYALNVLMLALLRPLDAAWDFVAGNAVSFVLSVLWSFYWNSRFVFAIKEGEEWSVSKALLRTYISYGFTGIVLNNLLGWFWIQKVGVSKFIAPLINLAISVPVNFAINKFWAFKAK